MRPLGDDRVEEIPAPARAHQKGCACSARGDRFGAWLRLGAGSRVLEVACGSGGPALHLARTTGCEIVGVDLREEGVAQAERMAREAGLDGRASSRRRGRR